MRRILILLAAAFCLFSCTTKAPRMVIIGLDGLGSAYLDSLDIPVMRSLMAEGSYTMHKRSVNPSSSAINWASMFNGLPTELHGYIHWNSQGPEYPCPYVTESGFPPTVFTLCRDQRPKSKIIGLYEWGGIKYCLDTVAFDALRSTYKGKVDNAITTQDVIECLTTEKPDLLYIDYDSPDHDGHTSGFGSPEYSAKVEELDTYIGEIIDALKQAGMYEETVIVIVSDHGGVGRGHGNLSLEEMEAPLIISGPGIRKGYEIPGLVMQYDAAATMADILGLSIPDFWRGRPLPVKELAL